MKGKFKFVYTTKRASWLNVIGNLFGKITRNLLKTIVESINEFKEKNRYSHEAK